MDVQDAMFNHVTSEFKKDAMFNVVFNLQQLGLSIYADIINERSRQNEKWGEQNHSPVAWLSILGEEVGEACKEVNQLWIDGKDYKDDKPQLDHLKLAQAYKLRQELIQVAAVTVAMIESLDRNELKDYKAPFTVTDA